MSTRLATLVAIGACLLTAVLQADDVAALPGFTSTGQSVSVYSVNPLSPVGAFNAGNATFVFLPKPDGTKYYAVANAGSGTVTVVDSSFSNPHSIGSFTVQAAGAAITPDGKKLLVATGTVHIIDTSTDTDITPGGLVVGPGFNDFDIAVSLDGSKAYVLGLNVSGSQLNTLDLSSNTVVATATIPGIATNVAVGLNGLVYVTSQNQISELNPITLAPTVAGVISLNGRPAKLVFTADGRYAMAVNQTPITGQAILLIDLAAHVIAGIIPNNGFNVQMDYLLVGGNNTIFAYSSQNQSLYQVTIGTAGALSIAGVSIGGVPFTSVTAATVSNEVAANGRLTPQYLFVASGGTLYRVDLTVGQITAQTPTSSQTAGLLTYVALANAGPAASLLQYGDNQNISPSTSTLPLVVRALDANNKPVSGVTITFSTAAAATVSPTTVVTGSNGFAQTTLTASASASGIVPVNATDGTHTATFTVNVGSGATGSTGGIAIVAGQGQVLQENINTLGGIQGSPLTVLVTDVNGLPVTGAAVTFTLTNGVGSIFGGSFFGSNTASIFTDSNGMASVNYSSSAVPPGSGFTQASITASAPGTATVTFYVTTYPVINGFAEPPIIQFLTPQIGAEFIGQAGTIIKSAFTAIVVSYKGEPIPNIGIRTNPAGDPNNPPADPSQAPSATCNDPTGQGVVSDATGNISCDLLLNGKIGVTRISVNIGYQVNGHFFPLTITAGPPGAIAIIQGNSQTGRPGQQLPVQLRVQVTDGFKNILPGTPVTWTVLTKGSVILSNVSSLTDFNGVASAVATLGPTGGAFIVKVTAGSVSASFTLTVTIPASGIQQVSGNGQSALINATFASRLVVRVVDPQGNGVSGAQVTFNLTSGSASIGTPSSTTDSSGQASTNVTAGARAGTIVIDATSSGFTTTFTLAAQLPGPQNVAFSNGASFQPGLSPGAIVTVTGTGIATGVQGVVSAINIVGALPTTLAGVSISFNGIFAPIFYVANVNGQESVTIQVPFEINPGTATVVINAAGGGTATLSVQVLPYSPGVFENTYGNQRVAVAVRPDGSYASPANPARRGEVIRVFVTGLGQVSPATATNSAGIAGQNVLATLVIGLNNGGVALISAQYAPGQVGVYVITIQVPPDTQTGPAQPFAVVAVDAAGNQYFSQGTNIPVQ